MRKTVLTHFFNEEYLLPWWIKHHQKYFDHGILIDYHSTDRSVEIVKTLAPDWTLITTRNPDFKASAVDQEVMDIEENIEGWKICLNVTEFILGDFAVLTEQTEQLLTIPCSAMVDLEPGYSNLSYDTPLVLQKPFGIYHSEGGFDIRHARAIHNKKREEYTFGRHYLSYNCDKLQILWYGWSPFTDRLIQRKAQIQTRIPESDFAGGFGKEHIVTYQSLIDKYQNELVPKARDLTPEIKQLMV